MSFRSTTLSGGCRRKIKMAIKHRQPRITVRQLKADAQKTLTDAQGLIAQSKSAVANVEAKAIEAIDEVLDGITLELVVAGRVVPVKLKVVPKER